MKCTYEFCENGNHVIVPAKYLEQYRNMLKNNTYYSFMRYCAGEICPYRLSEIMNGGGRIGNDKITISSSI